MTKAPFVTMTAATAVLGTALGSLALQLRADGYEQYVESVATFSVLMYVTAALVVVTWVRDGRRRQSG
ncbi:SCO3870 family protein [Streptomyces caatingaensis]|uniref:Membrane protein n=1 Tax=Streptomyces caatingaensis TaxID=1678637 RepID=A0A0K9XEX9_9ACTN|nr:SCO3870 family protein [Streptomyces caatingaensis]KNB51641.1 membrane protein [Streptomyces caatingaensis]